MKLLSYFTKSDIALLMLGLAVGLTLWISKIDITIYKWAMANLTGAWQELFSFLSTIGQGGIQIFISAVAGAFCYWRCAYDKARAWFVSIPLIIIIGLSAFPFKVLIGRPRPKMLWQDFYGPEFFELGARFHSFPSGHTTTTFALLGVLWVYYPSVKWRILLTIIASIVALGRVGIGAHYMGDIVMGAAFGFVLGKVAMAYVSRKYVLEK